MQSLGDAIGDVLATLPESAREQLAQPLTVEDAAELERVTGFRAAVLDVWEPGCERWCKGRGFRKVGSTFRPLSTDHVTSVSETISGLAYAYCLCSAGTQAKIEHERLRDERDRRLAQQAADRIWSEAELPPKLRRYTLEGYLALTGTSEALVARLHQWQGDTANLLLWGPAGTCKTGLGSSLFNEALAAGQSCLYVVAPDLLDRIRLTYRKGGEGEPDQTDVLDSLTGVDVLFIDDLGKSNAGDPLSGWAREQLFKLVNRRDNHFRRTIATTNLTLDQLEAYVDTPTFDRLTAVSEATGESYVIELSGPSRRGMARAS